MMLVPVVLVLSWMAARTSKTNSEGGKGKVNIPWFAILFLLVICFNSLNLLPKGLVEFIQTIDVFLLTMAMTALGAETSIDKFKKAGFKPFLLAAILYCWLLVGGYFLVKFIVPTLI